MSTVDWRYMSDLLTKEEAIGEYPCISRLEYLQNIHLLSFALNVYL